MLGAAHQFIVLDQQVENAQQFRIFELSGKSLKLDQFLAGSGDNRWISSTRDHQQVAQVSEEIPEEQLEVAPTLRRFFECSEKSGVIALVEFVVIVARAVSR